MIKRVDDACEFVEELEWGETPPMVNLNFEGPLCAPMRVAEQESWWGIIGRIT